MLLLGAGLPVLPGLAGESKSYAERLFNFPKVGALSKSDAAKALQEPARTKGVVFEQEAIDQIYQLTEGYPYFLQEWGYLVWNCAESSPITVQDVNEVQPKVIQRLNDNFFRVRFDRLTPGEKNFLRMMAQLGPGPYRLADVAAQFKVKVSTLSPTRSNLLKKGMIFSPTYGTIAFTVPLFDQFMHRAMPSLPNATNLSED